MIKLYFYLLVLFFISCSSPNPLETPMFWEISQKELDKPSYLFGTYHSKDKKVNTLPSIIYSKIKTVSRFYSEIPMTSHSTQEVASFSRLSDPIPLHIRLHPRTLKQLKAYIKQYKIPLTIARLSSYKTWAISLILSNQGTRKNDSPFMDESLSYYAKENHIKQAGLETVREQLIYFDTLPVSLQEQLLLDILSLKEDTGYTDALENWYKKGKAEGFYTLQKAHASSNPKQMKLDKALYDGLLLERNTRFTRRMHVLLQQNKALNYFFAIGAGHLSGEKGVIAGLKKLGYTVKKVK